MDKDQEILRNEKEIKITIGIAVICAIIVILFIVFG